VGTAVGDCRYNGVPPATDNASEVKIPIRIALLLALAGFNLLRLWIGVLALAQGIGPVWGTAVLLGLLLSGWLLPLQIAVFLGALILWRWPLPLALMLAAPRLLLMLPGLVSTFLASRRHPRPRWSRYRPV
jgi:hypothetical protein